MDRSPSQYPVSDRYRAKGSLDRKINSSVRLLIAAAVAATALLVVLQFLPTKVRPRATVSADGAHLVIRNNDDFTWEGVTLVLNGGEERFECRLTDMEPGAKKEVDLDRFCLPSGKRFNAAEYELIEVTICVAGHRSARYEFSSQ
jgi:hypothetical protein